MTGIELIAKERQNQLSKYTDTHDDEHSLGELVKVAAVLQLEHTDAMVIDLAGFINDNSRTDPWGLSEKHRYDLIKKLSIAGALIAAEIDRIKRSNE